MIVRPTARHTGSAIVALALVLAACRSIIGYEDGLLDSPKAAGSDASDAERPEAGGVVDAGRADADAEPGDGDPLEFAWDAASCVTIEAGPPPSCDGLAKTCGPDGKDDCCASTVIPGGTFQLANRPFFPTALCDFRLDTYEITVGRFRKFVAAYEQHMIAVGAAGNPNNRGDPGWLTANDANLPASAAELESALHCNSTYETWTNAGAGNESLPIDCLSWYEAAAFCAWDNGRLPTQAEWSYAAAGGSEQRLYPWGGDPPGDDVKLAVWGCNYPSPGLCSDIGSIAPVGSAKAGNAKWGQADMAGNVWEWVQDSQCTQPVPCFNCACLDSSNQRITVGGSFFEDSLIDTSYYLRNDIAGDGVAAYHKHDQGARCARAP